MQPTEILNSTQPKLQTQTALQPPKMNRAMDVSQAGRENGDSGCQAKKTDNTPMTETSQKTCGGANSRVRIRSKYLSYPYTSSGLKSFPTETEGTPSIALKAKASSKTTTLDKKRQMKRKKTKAESAARRKMKSPSGPSDTNTNAEITVNESGNKCSLVPETFQNPSSLAVKKETMPKKKQKLDVAQQHQGAEFVSHLDAKSTECSPLVVDSQNKRIGKNKEERVPKVSNPYAVVASLLEHLMTPPLDMQNKIIGENKEEQVPKISNSPAAVAPPLQNNRIGENKEEQVPKVSNPPAVVAPPMEHFMTSPLDLQNKRIGEKKDEQVPKVSNSPAGVAPPLEHLSPTQPTRPMSMSDETSPTLQLFDQILHKMSLVLEKLRE